jgi:hypothetical protein
LTESPFGDYLRRMVTDTYSRGNRTPLLDPLQVKISLLKRGMTINGWASARGWNRMAVWRAVNLGMRGPTSRRIAEALAADLGMGGE